MHSIRNKMLIWFGGSMIVLLSLLGIVHFIQVRDTVIPLTHDLSTEVLVARSAEIGRLIHGYITDIITLAKNTLIREGSWEQITDAIMSWAGETNPDYEIVFFADQDGRYITTLGAKGTIVDRDYFQAIMHEGFDDFISHTMISRSTGERIFVVASAVIDLQGKRKGLIASTVLLETLSNIVGSIRIGAKGFGYVIDHDGLLIAHPDDKLRMTLNFLQSDSLGYLGLQEIGRKMIEKESGIGTYRRPDGTSLATVFNPIPHSPDWTLGISLFEEELIGTARELIRKTLSLMIIVVCIVLVVVVIISNRIASPIKALKEGVNTVSSGNLDHTLSIRAKDEIGDLAKAYNRMTQQLKTHIITLQKTTAEKERIEGELRIANKIQTSMLPHLFPPFPHIHRIDLYATMEPAREVGGDFYDFFLVNDRFLYFSIGDVSGKGIPAALFMVITRTILKNQTMQGDSLSDIFYHTNQILCTENEENMFVSVFMGKVDIQTGVLEFINAGHNPPLISRKKKPYEFLTVDRNLVLGCVPNYRFSGHETILEPNDVLLLFTDGVTEATNMANDLFSNERLVQTVNNTRNFDTQTILKTIRHAIDGFVLESPASDDVTMLAIRLREEPIGRDPAMGAS